MKQLKFIFLQFFCIALFFSCNGDGQEVAPTYPLPEWRVDSIGKYQSTMTSVVKMPTNLVSGLSENDVMAVFIGDQCRGIGRMVELKGIKTFFILIQGGPNEVCKGKFKYYNAKSSHLYETDAFLSFEANRNYGIADSPEVPPFKIVMK